MMFRLLLLLALLAGSMFTQPGPLESASDWTADSLSGQLTVLVFYTDTSHDLQSVISWNALVQQFAGKPIQFASSQGLSVLRSGRVHRPGLWNGSRCSRDHWRRPADRWL
jgi:hypothetical protein